MQKFRIPRIPFVVILFFVVGGIAWLPSRDAHLRDTIWYIGLIVTGVPVAWKTLRGLFRGEFAADVVAMLAIFGAIALQQPLAGLVVVLMQTGGEALENYAVARASGAVEALEADAPRHAHRQTGQTVTDINAVDIVPNDILLVRPGELVPCDGEVVSGSSHVDTSSLTGEPVPIKAMAGTLLLSGSVNQEGALTIRAIRTSQESQYARIVELVRSAQASKSPLQRTADKVAVWFTPLTLFVCLVAWLVSHDWTRVLAVLVVATPCPLLLAAPVAIIGGINRAARRAIIVRSGGALEALARVQMAIFDKTGTLTVGRPHVQEVVVHNGESAGTLLALASAVELGSGHLLARVIVAEADGRGLQTQLATNVVESPGQGVSGDVDGVHVSVGSAGFIRHEQPQLTAEIGRLEAASSGLSAYVATGNGEVGRIDFADELRTELPKMFRALNALGIHSIQLLSGDREENVATIAKQIGISEFAGDLSAEDKLNRVAALEASGVRVLMVGDGTNDAPALSAATVGVALAGHGGGVVAEAADVVLLIDDPSRVAEAIQIGRRSMRIARQSIGVGIGLSITGMLLAAAGYLTPVVGALAQEAIDVAVILNALRASFDTA